MRGTSGTDSGAEGVGRISGAARAAEICDGVGPLPPNIGPDGGSGVKGEAGEEGNDGAEDGNEATEDGNDGVAVRPSSGSASRTSLG